MDCINMRYQPEIYSFYAVFIRFGRLNGTLLPECFQGEILKIDHFRGIPPMAEGKDAEAGKARDSGRFFGQKGLKRLQMRHPCHL